jgi:hypothetical protein
MLNRSLRVTRHSNCALRMKASRDRIQGHTAQPLSVAQGFAFLYDQLCFNEAKAIKIDQGEFHEKETAHHPTTTKLLESFQSLNR